MADINLALNKSTVSSSSVIPYTPSRAVDGSINPLSRWLSNTVPSWMGVDLGSSYAINRWVVRHLPVAGWAAPNYCMSDFKFQGSNDPNLNWSQKQWSDLDVVNGNIAPITDRKFISGGWRYVRVYVTKGLNINKTLASFMELEVYQAGDLATLSNLTVSSGSLTPPFTSGTTAYTDSVDFSVSSITVLPTATDTRAQIKVNGTVVVSGTPSSPIALNYGSNTVTIQVTSYDGSKVQNYTLTANRAGSPLLSNMIVNGATITPNFSSGVFSYSSGVSFDTSSVTVTPTAQDSRGSITVNGTVVASGSTSNPVSLNVGSNSVGVVVTPVGGGSQTYTTQITRNGSPYLSGLSLTGISVPFAKNTFNYNLNVGNDVTSTSVTATPEDSSATIIITANGTVVNKGQLFNLNLGSNTITVDVTASVGGANQKYTLVINRSSSDIYLSGLQIKLGKASIPLSPTPFDKTVGLYSGSCARTNNLMVVATAEAPDGVNIMVNQISAISGVGINIVVTPGASNLINIDVTSKTDGTSKRYQCTIVVSN